MYPRIPPGVSASIEDEPQVPGLGIRLRGFVSIGVSMVVSFFLVSNLQWTVYSIMLSVLSGTDRPSCRKHEVAVGLVHRQVECTLEAQKGIQMQLSSKP